MEKQLKILITGATGKSGGAAIDELLKMATRFGRSFIATTTVPKSLLPKEWKWS
jgi:nucleoside-diphosphate-sugar epimerase